MRWATDQTGWDLGEVSPPIKAYIDQLKNKDIAILIPGCGNAYEAKYLSKQGFTNITLIDIAELACKRLQQKFHNNESVKVVCQDFFNHHGNYDLILEQTFFCAINPGLRKKYVSTMFDLLNESGRVAGLLFASEFESEGPPFGGNPNEYINLFNPYFNIKKMEPCYNSAQPRANNELFIILEKKITLH